MVFKIAYCAGHYKGTPGKRVPKALDPNQTREWVLNDRVADFFEEAAGLYEGVELLRTDDPTGKKHISTKNRTKKANAWGADLYLDLHHNAGIKLGTGGGVTVFCDPGDEEGKLLRNEIYNEMIASGGLKGNRSQPLREKRYNTMKYAKMTAILIENGFMDSRTDYPIISTASHAKLTGYAIMKGIAKHYGLKEKTSGTQKNEEVYCKVNVRVLKNGASGKDVKAMQILLEANGCKGKMDSKKYGFFGDKSEAAVEMFQKKVGLPQTGQCDASTWAALLGTS